MSSPPNLFIMDFNTTLWSSSFPFRHHLKTNYIPSDAEVLLIKSLLVRPSEILQQISDEMLCLKEQLDFLSRKHGKLAHQLATCRSLLTLPRRLPDDILLEIFHHSLPGLSTGPYQQSTLLTLTQVCSRWRQLALSTPTLWSTIHIPICSSSDTRPRRGAWDLHAGAREFHRRRATAAMDWLDRSGPLPIKVSLFVGSEPISSPFFDFYTRSLVPSSSRWKSLFIQAPGATLREIATIPARDLNVLESLFLHFESNPGGRHQISTSTDWLWIESELFTAPSLRKLSIHQDLFDPTHICVNWSNLTHLEIGGAPDPRGRHSPFLSLPKASGILQFCSRLVYCMVELGQSWFDQESDIQIMHLPVLLRLSIGERIDIQPFVEKLFTPILEELNFRSRNVKSREHSNCLVILSRTGRTIRKLAIDCEFFSNQHFLESLWHCPYLASLTVKQQGMNRKYYTHDEEEIIDSHFRIDDPFLERMTTKGPNSLCPLLEEFICELDSHFTLTGFIEFLRLKQSIGHTLGLVKLKNLSIERLPDPPDSYEFDLSAITEMLRPYISDLKFQIKSSRSEPSERVPGNYGNATLQHSDVRSV